MQQAQNMDQWGGFVNTTKKSTCGDHEEDILVRDVLKCDGSVPTFWCENLLPCIFNIRLKCYQSARSQEHNLHGTYASDTIELSDYQRLMQDCRARQSQTAARMACPELGGPERPSQVQSPVNNTSHMLRTAQWTHRSVSQDTSDFTSR
jgi:hypothetical protein